MKLFFTLFAAILCAAAVIWGFISFREGQEREMAKYAKSLRVSAESSKLMLEMSYGKITPDIWRAAFESASQGIDFDIEILKKYGGKIDDAGDLRRAISMNYNITADNIEKSMPAKASWAAAVRSKVDELDRVRLQ